MFFSFSHFRFQTWPTPDYITLFYFESIGCIWWKVGIRTQYLKDNGMECSLLIELYHPALPEVLSTETVKYDGILFLTLLKCFFSLSRNISFKGKRRFACLWVKVYASLCKYKQVCACLCICKCVFENGFISVELSTKKSFGFNCQTISELTFHFRCSFCKYID